jgi:hypothetical protein
MFPRSFFLKILSIPHVRVDVGGRSFEVKGSGWIFFATGLSEELHDGVFCYRRALREFVFADRRNSS